MTYSRTHCAPHDTKHAVKILAGENKGAVALFSSEEDAKAECFYLADISNIPCARYLPLTGDYL